jgi:acetolactate synthase I/II/III large subunit
MHGNEALVEMLVRYGVEYVFGVPGDTNVGFYEALRRRQESIRHIMARDERSAGFMADAYARLSNRPAVFEAPSGAGPMYSLPAVAEAHYSAVPVILLTFDMPIGLERRGVISEFPAAKIFDAITKDSYQVKSLALLPEAIRRAFRTATSGRPGAVHLVIAEDLLRGEIDPSVSLHAESECARFPAFPAAPEPTAVGRLVDLLGTSRWPLIVAGGGVNRSGAAAKLRGFAEEAGLPVVTTITGQGALPDEHPLAIGVIGDNGFHPHAAKAVEEADLLIYLGSKLGSVVTSGWTFPSDLPQRRIVQVDIDPAVLGNATRNELSICADIGMLLDALAARWPYALGYDSGWLERINGWRRQFWQAVGPDLADDSAPLKPARVMQALNERLRGPLTIVSDPGTPTPYLNRFLKLRDADCAVAIPRAFGGLGYAIPGAIGAWLARPKSRLVAMFGDGSFGMSVGELETIARVGAPVLLLNFNNGEFGLIKGLQKMHGHNMTQSVDFARTDAAKIAAAYGIRSWHVTDAAGLDAALDAALAEPGPAFIDLVVESIAEIAPPMFGLTRRLGHDPLSLTPPRQLRMGRIDRAAE